MNKKQVKIINEQISTLEELEAKLSDLHGELQEAFDVKSDRWKESEKGEAAQAELEALQEVIDETNTLRERLEELRGDWQ